MAKRSGSNDHGNKGYHSKKQPRYKSQPKLNKNEIDLLLVGQNKMGISIPYHMYSQEKKKVIKVCSVETQDNGGVWQQEYKIWVVDMNRKQPIIEYLLSQCQPVTLNDIPATALTIVMKEMPLGLPVRLNKTRILTNINYDPDDIRLDPTSLPFFNNLFSFQKQAVHFAVKHYGRVLIADEMGVGKTVEALGAAYMYQKEWPLLIICPSSLKYTWKQQVLRWYRNIKEFEVQIFQKTGSILRDKMKVLIISYELAQRCHQTLAQRFQVAIADEAHYLKGLDTKRAQTVVPLLKCCKRIFLLTGTPAFAKPKQLFSLLSIIRPDVYYNFVPFGQRYCNPQKSPWSNGIIYDGSKNVAQLNTILNNGIMIRRRKADVLTELPDKMRQKIIVETDPKYVKQISAILSSMGSLSDQLSGDAESNDNFIKCYGLTGLAKLESVKQYIDDVMENDVKVLIFAHHKVVVEEIEKFLTDKKIQSIRIDGETPSELRFQRVQQFQSKPIIRAAILSITAAGVGLTLTAASTVIFAELHWTPAALQQAEDRAHRIGQKSSVNCHYLVGQGTIDEILYYKLESKLVTVGQMIDGQSSKLQAEEVQKGQLGKISKDEPIQISNNKIQQEGIRKFFKTNKPKAVVPTQSDISQSVKQQSKNLQVSEEVSSDEQQQLKRLKNDAEQRFSEHFKSQRLSLSTSRYKQNIN